jgi:hypothetical protein
MTLYSLARRSAAETAQPTTLKHFAASGGLLAMTIGAAVNLEGGDMSALAKLDY